MLNRDITRILKLTAQLLELHDENTFKIKAYSGIVYQIEQKQVQVSECDTTALLSEGFTAKQIEKISEIISTGTLTTLEEKIKITPVGLLDILNIKGLGIKKVRVLWQELNIVDIEGLHEVALNGELEKIKGFGKKTVDKLIAQIEFIYENRHKIFYAQALPYAQALHQIISDIDPVEKLALTGEMSRFMEVIETIQFVVATDDPINTYEDISEIDFLLHEKENSGTFAWRGTMQDFPINIEILLCEEKDFEKQVLIKSSSENHLTHIVEQKSILQHIREKDFKNEEDFYKSINLPYIPAEIREGLFEFSLKETPVLITDTDIKGSIHNHSTYSDGQHTLREMAEACIEMGYQYFGISDHSKTAFYANGLSAERIAQQHIEIDQLNKELAPFKILKGIESDILTDGSLDYDDKVLASFDFIVASIHSNLDMDIEKATTRLLNAIKNPYTTILGHPTGRLLLRRKGYPIDHKAIIDACAEHNVMIEINASPYRLDLDWRWVNYAIKKGVMISINPDAHHTDGLQDTYYGVLIGRKGGLTATQTLNAHSLVEVENIFEKKKKEI